ncbi:MAG: ATP-binding protein [Leptospiraceae bacterium]|nr:ATP-binding protein [Leptospiraceae bacterium]
MATLYLICGMSGSGKTTLAKELEANCVALRLCPDEWISLIIKNKHDKNELDRLRAPIEGLMWDLAKKLLISGVDIILENGFWSREERIEYLRNAKQVDADVKVILHYLDLSIEKLWDRIQKRKNFTPFSSKHLFMNRTQSDFALSF